VLAAVQLNFIKTRKFTQNPLNDTNGPIITMGLELSWALL